jgi:hypothetical protein
MHMSLKSTLARRETVTCGDGYASVRPAEVHYPPDRQSVAQRAP